MIFKDRQEAGQLLAKKLAKDKDLKRHKNNLMVFSLLRGGVVIGAQISKKLNIPHYPLIVAKIPAPYNPELAIGALCFKSVYLNKAIIKSLALSKKELNQQIQIAKIKQKNYIKQFKINIKDSILLPKNKWVILADDGIATGSTAKSACLFLKSTKAKKVFLATPVAPRGFNSSDFNKVFILNNDRSFSAVSRFYRYFPQIENKEVFKLFN